jgi:hypothetical protein
MLRDDALVLSDCAIHDVEIYRGDSTSSRSVFPMQSGRYPVTRENTCVSPIRPHTRLPLLHLEKQVDKTFFYVITSVHFSSSFNLIFFERLLYMYKSESIPVPFPIALSQMLPIHYISVWTLLTLFESHFRYHGNLKHGRSNPPPENPRAQSRRCQQPHPSFHQQSDQRPW